MKNIAVSIFVFFITTSVYAQFEQISVGQLYKDQVFYSLENGVLAGVEHERWDIAFSTQGVQDAGVFINEGSSLGDLSGLELYAVEQADFDQELTVDTSSWTRLYNPETDWQNGAFNTIRDSDDVFDYGWGYYNSSVNTVEGKAMYTIKLRSGEWKKIEIQSLFLDWKFKYANLDGSELIEVNLPKADHSGKVLAYYSIENDQVVDVEPFNWDLLFTRYNTYTDDGNGNFRNYVVTGVLSGLDVMVAEFDDVDPASLDHEDIALEEYKTPLDQIGFDWKTVDINSSLYTVDDDRVYFVQVASDRVCKVEFIDFEGATTGVTTIKKECYIVAKINEIEIDEIQSLSVFPNPTTERINILADFEEASQTEVMLIDATGRVAQKKSIHFDKGYQHRFLDVNVQAGAYSLIIKSKNKIQTLPIIVNR